MNGTNYLLMPRDLALLKEIAQLQVIDREQARTIGNFGSQTRLNYRLAALRSLGLLKQFFVGLGPGTKKAVFCLTRKGAQVARVPYRRTRVASASVLGFDPFLIHRIAIADIYVSVIHKPVAKGAAAGAWQFFEKPLTPNSHLIPDGYFELETAGARRGMAEVNRTGGTLYFPAGTYYYRATGPLRPAGRLLSTSRTPASTRRPRWKATVLRGMPRASAAASRVSGSADSDASRYRLRRTGSPSAPSASRSFRGRIARVYHSKNKMLDKSCRSA